VFDVPTGSDDAAANAAQRSCGETVVFGPGLSLSILLRKEALVVHINHEGNTSVGVTPAGLRSVTKEVFWEWVMKTQRNVHPALRGRWSDPDGFVSYWHDQRTGELIGFSTSKNERHSLKEGLT
jgi:hypothetical protein